MSIHIDPETQDSIIACGMADFDASVEQFIASNPHLDFDSVSWIDIAQQFFINGYISGALEAISNQDFKESIELMDEEIKYQQENNTK